MSALLHQNFTRDRHSADILSALASTLAKEPCVRLTYFDLNDSMACLEKAFGGEATEPPPAPEFQRFRLADLNSPIARKPTPDAPLQRRNGCSEEEIGGTLYLSDPEGRAIRRMDPLASAIWGILEEPASMTDIRDVVCEAFPDVPPDRIAADLDTLVRRLAKAGLITETT